MLTDADTRLLCIAYAEALRSSSLMTQTGIALMKRFVAEKPDLWAEDIAE